MDTRTARRWLLVAALAGPALPVRADPMVERLYARLAAAYAAGSGRSGQGPFMILANPGVPLSADLLKDPYDLSRILDGIPQPSRLYAHTDFQYSTLYDRILSHAQAARISAQADRSRAMAGKRLLYDRLKPGQPSREYADYLKCQADCAAAQDALGFARAEHKPPNILKDLDLALTGARTRWTQHGHKLEVETALADIQAYYDSDPAVRFTTLRNQLAAARVKAGHPNSWLPVTASPPAQEWLAEKGWQPWRFKAADPAPPPPAEVQGVPLLRRQAGTAPPAAPVWVASMALSVEVKRVAILRDWMDLALFRNHDWRLKPAAGITLVSTGNLADPDPGAMPFVITGILLARKLYVTASWSGDAGLRREVPASLGPFALPGPARLTSQPGGETGGFSIRADDPQIIAFFCEVLPRSPVPDPALFP